MGRLEDKTKITTKRKKIRDIILGTVAVAGVLSIGLVAPNVLGAMVELGIIPKKRQKDLIKRSRQRLVDNGFLEYKNGYLRLTQKGEILARRVGGGNFKLRKLKKWDKKWRVLIFDIKEEKRNLREKIRRTLVSLGFLKLQDSVWIYPYPCEDVVNLLKTDFKTGRELLYMIVEQLEYDKPVREYFGLPSEPH